MAIMQSCCCWRSVRRGSFACAIYSGIYFTVLALTTGKVLQGESQYLRGNRSLPESTSFLEPDTISPTTVRFNVTLLICSCCGVICSILLLYGLCKSTFDPTKVMLYTLNFFLLCLNIYSVLCVISQYQEYMAGRGTIADDYEYRVSILRVSQRKEERNKGRKVPAVRYAIQPPTTTATSCLSSRRAPTNNETKATATPTQSPTTGQNTLSLEKSPVTARPSRKHVQFPDTAPDSQNGKSEVPITMLVLQMEAENEHATSSTSLKLEEATIDQVLLSQKNSYSQHT
ncbi:uncharacterized protein LOC117153592 isoform X3 [Bombus vancouverensis nearcticus]|uniref:Uncharacterized protein LOC117204481 isoform X3 n=1 Tax=Bombus bifarius TaxID=103933 RepID=A0A6P8M596_9HYME|nr:uncharacterized protein LOC117153592 isoform X3 [Bombus vancouverensis nearcticus]XP_033297810.1 uncharacterized protein LOC117204481 isoform X3 [Bombus bifarius]XP_050477511.1 uncharacterized protein LOC126867264 isoform X3 [Bombus huntii]